MIRFLVDMCIDIRVVEWLHQQGYNAIHLRDEGLQRLPNGEIFTKAIDEKRVILTFDLDFSEIAAFSENHIVSVIVFRLTNTRAFHIIERLTIVLKHTKSLLEKGAIISVEETRFRVRELPIGNL